MSSEKYRQYQQRYRELNREKSKDYARRYRESNRNKLRDYARVFRSKHPDKVRSYNRKYYELNKEKVKQQVQEYRKNTDYHRHYYLANRERLIGKARQYRAANPDKIAKRDKEYRARRLQQNPNMYRELNWKHLYGITKEDFDALLVKQKGVCAVCGSAYTGSKHHGVLCIDHDHRTGAIRGLLCNNCNRALGLLKDNILVLKAAIQYLSKKRQARK